MKNTFLNKTVQETNNFLTTCIYYYSLSTATIVRKQSHLPNLTIKIKLIFFNYVLTFLYYIHILVYNSIKVCLVLKLR